jgi:hypothetical protein
MRRLKRFSVTFLAIWLRRRGGNGEPPATLACTGALCLYIFRITSASSWSPIDVLVSNPGALPIFGHRLLFVWLERSARLVVPGLSPLLVLSVRSYFGLFTCPTAIVKFLHSILTRDKYWK